MRASHVSFLRSELLVVGSLSLEQSHKLEACIRGQVESQSFSLWVLASIFEFLKV